MAGEEVLQSDGSRRAGVDGGAPLAGDFIDDLDGIIWELEVATGRFTSVSRGAERILGYPLVRWLDEPDFRPDGVVHPEDRDRVRTVTQLEAGAGRDHRVEYRAVAADGRVLWLRDMVRVVETEHGRRLRGLSIDVTAEKRVEEALSRRKEYYQAILDHVDSDFAVFDREGRFEYINPSSIRDPDVRQWAIGRTNVDYCRERGQAEEIGRRRHAHIEAAVREGRTVEVEETLIGTSRGDRVILRRHSPLRDEQGRVIRVIGQGWDITERKQTEGELRLEREKQEALLNAIPDMVWLKDEASRFLAVNEAYARAVGVPRKDIIGKTDLDFFPSEMAEAYRDDDRRVLRSGRQFRVDETVQRADGTTMHVETIKIPIRGPDGEPVGTAGIARDVTDRRRAEEALRSNEARFRTLIESVTDAIAIVESDGTIRYVSPAFERITGQQPGESAGRSALEGLHPDDDDAARGAFEQLLGTPEGVTSFEVRVRRNDAAWRHVEITVKNLLHDPVIRGVVVTYHDATERRSLEEQLRGAQKMEAVGRLAGGIAHDFNNVLTAIKGHAQFVLEDAAADDALGDDVREIVRCTDRADDLVRQLLAFSRQQVSEPRVIAPMTVVRGAEKMLRRLIGEDMELEITESPDPGPVRVDPTQMEQVLVNLAINARDAMPGGGKLRIGVDSACVGEDQPAGIQAPVTPGRYTRFTVADTGTGMDARTRERIFEPFFTTKPTGEGTGLGLATVYGIVRQAHGSIAVTSEPGAGSTFEVYIPQTEEQIAEQHASASATAGERGSETVLLVEDQDAVRSLARRALERVGYRVLEAASGSDAIRLWEDAGEAVDLLLTDVVMPQMSGKELARRLLDRRPDLKVLYMSGYAEEYIVHRGILEPGARLLEKPFDPGSLRARVREVIDRPTGAMPEVAQEGDQRPF